MALATCASSRFISVYSSCSRISVYVESYSVSFGPILQLCPAAGSAPCSPELRCSRPRSRGGACRRTSGRLPGTVRGCARRGDLRKPGPRVQRAQRWNDISSRKSAVPTCLSAETGEAQISRQHVSRRFVLSLHRPKLYL